VNKVKINTVNIKQCAREKSLRSDCAYQRMISKYYKTGIQYYSFNDLFSVQEEKIKLDELTGNFLYCQIGDVDNDGIPNPVSLDFDSRDLLHESYYSKIEKGDIMRVDENDFIMSFLLPQDNQIKGKFAFIDSKNKDIFFSTAFLRIRSKVHPKILFYALQSIFYKDLVATARIRKGYTGYATLSKDDLCDLKFAKTIIDKLINNHVTIEKAINKIEIQMAALQKKQLTSTQIINRIFQREFGFDYEKFEALKTNKSYAVKQVIFSNNPDLRFSVKFHRPTGKFVMEQLSTLTDKKIKHFLAEPIILGASVSPKDYDDNGKFSYISMAAIKNWAFDINSASCVSDQYAGNKITKSVKKNDIIIARSGEGTIGKVALITDDIDGIFADFTMRIRLKDYNPRFAYYYFRTTYFQYLVEIYKKGLGNNTNIFPVIIQEFPLLDISIDEQQRIVDEIQSEIGKQEENQKNLSDLRTEIDKIIYKAIAD